MTRMHEILGVEPGQRFWLKYNDGMANKSIDYFLDEGGNLRYYISADATEGSYAGMPELVMAINRGVIKKPKYMPEVLEKLKALQILGFKWLARDEDCAEWVYDRRPSRGIGWWNANAENTTAYVMKPPLGLTSWADPEPLSIDAAIKEAEGTP